MGLPRIDQFTRDYADDLIVHSLRLRSALLLADLHLALLQNLEDDVVCGLALAKSLVEVLAGRRLAL
ncbi:hypothetical protein HG530_002992 [Fusarium avenaceum]|nr:hypothetical protein HG530_002992 [Fusarium avenaceum]